ncbi:MAG: prepilin-type N-terminal cleavage/methylation domain-containing protein [Candidatus Omnitrophota bacterium]
MMSLIGRKGSNKGFLLLEAMVSIAILSIGLVVILSSFTRSIRAKELSEDYFKAGLLLEEKIFELSTAPDIEEGVSEGVFSDFGNRFSWSLIVARLEGEGLKEISLEVSWAKGNKIQYIPMVTYIYVPAAPAA